MKFGNFRVGWREQPEHFTHQHRIEASQHPLRTPQPTATGALSCERGSGPIVLFLLLRETKNNKQKQDLRQGEYAVDDEDVVVESLDINIAEVENKDEVETRLLMEVGMEFTQQSIWEFDWHQSPWTIKLPTGQLVNRVIARSNPIKP